MLTADAYKQTHHMMYPPGTEKVYMYTEARGIAPEAPKNANPVFFGLQYIMQKHLEGTVVTDEDLEEADKYCQALFGKPYFNREGFEYLIDEHNGKLPLKIRALPEGTRAGIHNAMFTVENTDPEVPWLPGFVESTLLRVWYPTTVATYSSEIRKNIQKRFNKTHDEHVDMTCMVNDFGVRGVSSLESSAIGGAAHMLSFRGTDNIPGMKLLADYYSAPPSTTGLSIGAAEHSTITSWENEKDAYENILDVFPSDVPVAIVSDSYDIDNAVTEIFGKTLKNKVMGRSAHIVIRPDSGDPVKMSLRVVRQLKAAFGGYTGKNGYFYLDRHVRVIYGDGINHITINKILDNLIANGFAPSNIVFGMGGALLQQQNRDVYAFANKCSAIKIDGHWRDVFKKPKYGNKESKKGRMKVVNQGGKLVTVDIKDPRKDEMETVFRDGNLVKYVTYKEIVDRMWE